MFTHTGKLVGFFARSGIPMKDNNVLAAIITTIGVVWAAVISSRRGQPRTDNPPYDLPISTENQFSHPPTPSFSARLWSFLCYALAFFVSLASIGALIEAKESVEPGASFGAFIILIVLAAAFFKFRKGVAPLRIWRKKGNFESQLMHQFTIGDRVRHISNGQTMVVLSTTNNTVAKCAWLQNGRRCQASFYFSELILETPLEPPVVEENQKKSVGE